jgi:aminoglycoside phosphotransferase (APT) family kinase protein
VTGIVDWSDAAITDPAYDLGLVYRDLGPAALSAALGSYRPGADDVSEIWDRAVFYARCTALEDLAHGITTGQDAYVRRSRAALDWLFPA